MLDDNDFSGYYEDLTLEKALHKVAPLFVGSLIRKHPSLMLAIVLADVAVELRNNHKSKRKFGELILLKDFQ
ncbi:hypothetical protein [Halobacteriovorax sp. JY17]|uniref:hypothetical protein n=1 Tax=Halobacteriovorax sp. JY17 TaxID=2014617 RepID=UPI000C3C3311|nr:hypothetical protein [Halobacteriovorax sp. JY17]PIK15094.1 MAG: hypothetical protein CES88_12230 [Halobacteriovorax sp. JY17]